MAHDEISGEGGQALRPGRVVVSAEDLGRRVRALGAEITADYEGRAPLLVGVLKGAFMFMSDLARAIDLPVEFDFMAISSYGHSTRSSGVVRIVKDLDIDLTDRDVIIVEDIIDSGLTLNYLRRNLLARNPASLEVCALLVRDDHRLAEGILRYEGFRIPSDFVVGYGLDAGERFRNLVDIRVVEPCLEVSAGEQA
jgi:hypoxanthine phosphoribosyltransferase